MLDCVRFVILLHIVENNVNVGGIHIMPRVKTFAVQKLAMLEWEEEQALFTIVILWIFLFIIINVVHYSYLLSNLVCFPRYIMEYQEVHNTYGREVHSSFHVLLNRFWEKYVITISWELL